MSAPGVTSAPSPGPHPAEAPDRALAQRQVAVGDLRLGNDRPLMLIAGPCALESRDHALIMAERLAAIAGRAGLGFIFKSSYDKANRTAADAPRGVGLEAALPIFAEIRREIGCALLTDVHDPASCAVLAPSVDVLQIPAFLCRQTDLIVAAARTGRPVHVKKGPFLAPADMAHVAAKVSAAGTGGVLLCERGTSFGHGDLVVDMRGLPIMAATGHPVIFDATHSVQQPGAGAGRTGGRRGFVPALARAAVAIGVAGLFIESHDRPDAALSDAATQFPLDRMPALIADLAAFDALAKTRPRPFDPDGQDNAA